MANVRHDPAPGPGPAPEYHALSQISMAPNRTVRLSEPATVSNMTLSHLSRVVSRLEKGVVDRVSPPGMARA
jgi:DNA-binding MarR family transcriptional regulator